MHIEERMKFTLPYLLAFAPVAGAASNFPSGYIYVGAGQCLDEQERVYDYVYEECFLREDPCVKNYDAESCAEECEVHSVGGLLGMEVSADRGCICLYEDGSLDDSLGLGSQYSPNITSSGSGPIKSVSLEALGTVCYKSINNDTLEFVGDGSNIFNGSENFVELNVGIGSDYFNSAVYLDPLFKLYAVDHDKLLNETVCDDTLSEAQNVELSGELKSTASSGWKYEHASLNLSGIEESNIYSSTSDTEGLIKFCARVDVFAKGTDKNFSVSFAETVVTLFVNMTTDFVIDNIEARKEDATQQDAKAKYGIASCICGANNDCDPNPVLSANQPYSACLRAESEGISVVDVMSVDIYRGGDKRYSPVVNSQPGALDSIDQIVGGKKINSRVRSNFFDAPEGDLKFIGEVLLEFDGRRRRVLVENNVFSDESEEKNEAGASFELTVKLKPLTDLEETGTDQEEERNDNVVLVGVKKDDSTEKVNDKDGLSAVTLNFMIGAGTGVLCLLMLVAGFRRARSPVGTGVALKYDGVRNSV